MFRYFSQNRMSWACALLYMLLMLCSCKEDNSSEREILVDAPTQSDKAKRLSELDSLRILAIGNSYTWDHTAALGKILRNAGVDPARYCVYILWYPAAPLEYWSKRYLSNNTDTISRVAGQIDMPLHEGTLQQLLTQKWDVVVLHQFSELAPNYNSYHPYLNILTSAIHQHCTNPDVLLAWNIIHSYWSHYEKCKEPSEKRWKRIVNSAKKVMLNDGFDILIPSGTAIQNARHTALNTEHELTRDGTHLALGVGRYIPSLAWAETLFTPVFDIDVANDSLIDDFKPGKGEYNYYDDYWAAVTDSNRALCQQCAQLACQQPYTVSSTQVVP